MSNEMHTDLIGLQNALLNTTDVDQFLHELAVLATRVVTDGLCCGMTLRHRGRLPATAACTDPLAAQADDVQFRTGDGPSLHAMRRGERVHIQDMTRHDRWPRFCGHAVSVGIRSCLVVPLITDGEPVGALALYARRPFAFGPDETRRADRFARNASGALTLALRMASCEDLNDQLRSSIASRAVIDQALGVIMATERCPQEKAFALLRTVSQNTNVKLRDLAATIVTSVSGHPPRPASPFEDG
ncbi:MAG TPA: GAF and ANTAR domain-containing protein [Trebonia sp.]|jgi:GAF domain-containing protein|nr:GAF and ANTAR domain-containing protein [Trebonia sp.]